MAAISQPIPQVAISGNYPKGKPKRGNDYWTPTTKVSIGALAGATTILLTPVLKLYWSAWTQTDMTPEIGTAVTTIVTFVLQYLVPDRKG